VSAITAEVVRELADFDPKGSPVTTCYLNVDGRERVRPVDYERDLERLIRRLKASGAYDASVVDDVERISSYVRNGLDRSSVRGLAMFSCARGQLWTVVPLPVPVHSRLTVGAVPAIAQLESVAEQLQPIGVILVDRQRTRLLVFEGGELLEYSESIDELPRDYDERGHASRGDVSSHVDELTHQHLRQAAKAAFALFQERSVGRVTIGGPAEAVAAIDEHLHPYLKERLVDRLRLGVNASLDEVRHAMLDVEARSERAEEAASVARLRDAVGAGSKGVGGLADTLAALCARRVELLLVSEGYAESGWRCHGCGTLAAIGPKCATCGGEMEHLDDVVEEAIQVALHQSCRIEMCVENADLDVLGRIGALLRF
jgi:peptide chain release factor subunit 1